MAGEEEKRAETEATFRNANERIRAAERQLGPPLERVPYICERGYPVPSSDGARMPVVEPFPNRKR